LYIYSSICIIIMKIVFAGTPEFAAAALAALYAAKHDVAAVLTQPDRPAGRGMQLQMSAVKQLALAHQTPVYQPRSLRRDGKYAEDAAVAQQVLQVLKPDVMVVAAYGLILPEWALTLPKLGCLNIHASLLPRWRGAAPIHRAIEAGDTQTGITLMQMDAGLDTGDMLLVQSIAIAAQDTTASLHDKLAAMGARMIVAALEQMEIGGLQRTPQPELGITYAHKIQKSEANIDWTLSATQIANKLRAFDPFPGASTTLNGEVIKLWQASVTSQTGAPGGVLRADAQGLVIACGQGAVNITSLQRAGGKRINAAALLSGFAIHAGDKAGDKAGDQCQ
jgi:methionyl-tRNA formyltransferase